jgi:hypothetical protein
MGGREEQVPGTERAGGGVGGAEVSNDYTSPRYEKWLDDVTDSMDLPDDYRDEYRVHLRETYWGHAAALSCAVREVSDAVVEGCPRWLRRLVRRVLRCES